METCRKLCENGRISDAVDALNLRVQQRCHVDNNLFYLVLKRCIAHHDLVIGRQIHALTIKCGYDGDAFLATHLISLYASNGRLLEAMKVFTKVSMPTVYNWTTIIFAYARHGEASQALRLYRQMLESTTINPDNRLFVAVLKACAALGNLVAGKEVHAHILANPGKPNIFVQAALISMYAKCASLGDAQGVFDGLPERNVVAWNAMLAGYSQQGMGGAALYLYGRMQQEGLTPPNSVTYLCLLQACAAIGEAALDQGKRLHAEIKERGLEFVVSGSLISMYAKCGSLGDAHMVFERLPERDVVTWTALIAGYVQQGMGQEALKLYSMMQHESRTAPNSITYACLLQACANVGIGAVHQGKQLHAQIAEQGLDVDLVLSGSLVNMYAKCGSLEDARRVFDILPSTDIATCNALLSGYAQHGMGQQALCLYRSMQHHGFATPNSVTYACVLQACASVGLGALKHGKQFHAEIERRGLQEDLVLGGSLVNMYAKCGNLVDARRVFDRLPARNVLTWTALIAGYTQQGMAHEALSLYGKMQQERLSPNSITYVCLLQACAIVAALPLGKQLHAQIKEQGLEADVAVATGLVNMYAKCGSMFESQQVFDSLLERSTETWNALTGGYARQGDTEAVFDLVDRMILQGVQPDGITFLCLLTVCSHVGQVDKGCKYFEVMKLDYGISPTIEHYTCMVDLLGRAGHLNEALWMAKTMPFLPDVTVWHTLLGACGKWQDVEIGQQAFEYAVSVDVKNAASYVLMSNIYANAKMWEEAKEMQARRRKCGAWKELGQSCWTDLGGGVHTFVVGDKSHPESDGIYVRLAQLVPKMKNAGYVPQLHSSLREIANDERDLELCGHNENLAIAYALNKTPNGTPIRIVRNLRVCEDCHVATGFVSNVERKL